MSNFEIFTETRARTKEYISITDNKAFGLPRTFLTNQKVSSEHKCVILYDEESRQIALYFTKLNPKFGLSVRVPNDKHGGMVMARSFFDLKGIDVTKYAGRYNDFEKKSLKSLGIDKDGDAYVIKLDEQKNTNPKPNKSVDSVDVRYEDKGIVSEELKDKMGF